MSSWHIDAEGYEKAGGRTYKVVVGEVDGKHIVYCERAYKGAMILQ